MRDLKLNDLTAYEQHIGQSAPELDELIEETIVAESWFFRDKYPFEWLRAYVRRGWISLPGRRPLQILSLACAAGEEPYSIAIALSEEGLPTRRYHIDAIDISARRLARARRGIYSQNAFRGSGALCHSRYFRPHSEGYEIDQEMCSEIRFIQGNVLDPGLLDRATVYDVIFCRNLLIYLVPSARAAVLALIDRVLSTDGVLFIGHADRLDTALAGGGFVPTGDPGCFAYRRISCAEPSARTSSPSIDSPKPRWVCLRSSNLCTGSQQHGGDHRRRQRSGHWGWQRGRDAASARAVAFVGSSFRACQSGAVHGGCRLVRAASPGEWSDRACVLFAGDDLAGRRRPQTSRRVFWKTVYLDPHHDEALLALALLAEHRGDQSAAAGFRRRAERTAALARKRVN